MTYRLDPDRGGSSGEADQPAEARAAANLLLDRLNVAGGRKVKQVQVKKVSLELDLE